MVSLFQSSLYKQEERERANFRSLLVDKYFARECKLLAECRHPNIVQYLGLCLAPGTSRRILIISEYLTNGNLRGFIYHDDIPFPWRLRISFGIDVARAMTYLHARNCLHRDLKGENLLLTELNRVKVCDFGFARIAARNEEEMRRMSYCGTDGCQYFLSRFP